VVVDHGREYNAEPLSTRLSASSLTLRANSEGPDGYQGMPAGDKEQH